MKKVFLAVLLGVSLVFTLASHSAATEVSKPDTAKPRKIDPAAEKRIQAKLPGLRLPFIKNESQADKRVKYYAKTFAGTVFVSDEDITYALPGSEKNREKRLGNYGEADTCQKNKSPGHGKDRDKGKLLQGE